MKEEIQGPSRTEIWKMFDQISPTYDCVNRVMSFGLDQLWRKRLCSFLPKKSDMRILDCATGTGDQIIALLEKKPDISSVVGIDLAEAMLEIGKEKIARKPYAHKVEFHTASALDIPYPDNHFDCVTISFGIRNVTDIMAAFKEFRRVLKPGGRVLILEGTIPRKKWLRSLHLFYLRHFLPKIGGLISQNFKAYRYLNETIESFPQGEKFNGKMRAAGFIDVRSNLILGGITTVYQGDKDAHVYHSNH
ncbi:MAG: bifunctional demethylmenaquinone methyltransferase/2-methoxy-6-polyprenyl-1,4-benzoquinol methylase UbiE [Verrucomicrobia bacterium]|nr:bifunctional demethylmenaquinone methyltransferase/2-methoxy-6-polyprenyl-1,4-benzoquinol methylase UbiE [Verrucomicrobiota bacterium]